MIKINYKYIYISVTLLLAPSSSFAVLGLVHDPINHIALMLNHAQLIQQFKVLENEYTTAKSQLSEAQQLKNDAEYQDSYGSLYNSSSDFNNRNWSPSSWKDALQGESGGNAARYQQLLGEYQQNHPTLTQQKYQTNTSQSQASRYNQDVQVNRAATVNSTLSYNDIQTHLKMIHQLSLEINKAKNTKAAMDLNSRLVAELAYIQTQQLKMQTLLNQQIAQQHSDDIAERTEAAKTDVLPQH